MIAALTVTPPQGGAGGGGDGGGGFGGGGDGLQHLAMIEAGMLCNCVDCSLDAAMHQRLHCQGVAVPR